MGKAGICLKKLQITPFSREVIDLQRAVRKADSKERAVGVQGKQVVVGVCKAVVDRSALALSLKINAGYFRSVRRIVDGRRRLIPVNGGCPRPIGRNCDGRRHLPCPYRFFVL